MFYCWSSGWDSTVPPQSHSYNALQPPPPPLKFSPPTPTYQLICRLAVLWTHWSQNPCLLPHFLHEALTCPLDVLSVQSAAASASLPVRHHGSADCWRPGGWWSHRVCHSSASGNPAKTRTLDQNYSQYRHIIDLILYFTLSPHLEFNPITVQGVKFPCWKVHTYRPANSISDGPITNLLSILCIWTEILWCAHVKGTKKPSWFQIWHFYFRMMAWQVKGLEVCTVLMWIQH